MSILDLSDSGLDETWEPTTVKSGEEYKLRIVSFVQGTDKNGNDYIMPFFEVVDEPRCKEFGDYMPIPNPGSMGEKELNKARLRLATFLRAFDLGTQIDIDEDAGKEGWAILGMGKDQDGEKVNKVNKYVAGS